jgi:hypothetical protein
MAGFEFEFGNLPIEPTAQALQSALGGRLEIRSPFEAVLHDSELGRLKVERDAEILKSVRYRKWLSQLGVEFVPGSIAHGIESNIDNASSLLIPGEVVTAPLPFDRLHLLDKLVNTLSELGAQGTQDSLVYAFGMHINPRIPAEDPGTLRRYLQAFLLLHDWIIESSSIDITRRFLTKFIDPFPPAYTDLLLDTSYEPDLADFIDDYLVANPTRNRALDLLPVFYHLDGQRVYAALSEEERVLVKGRPAFHYRLPDCKINEPGWGCHQAWNTWVYIETLATDRALLEELIGAWRSASERFSIAPRTTWVMQLTSLLSEKYLADRSRDAF